MNRSGSLLLSAVIHAALLVGATLPVAMANVSDGCGSGGADRYGVQFDMGMLVDRIEPTNRLPELFGRYSMDPRSSTPEDDAGPSWYAYDPSRWGFGPGDEDGFICCRYVFRMPPPRDETGTYFTRVADSRLRRSAMISPGGHRCPCVIGTPFPGCRCSCCSGCPRVPGR